MGEVVLIRTPVSKGAAEAPGCEATRRKIGKLASDVLCPPSPEHDPLAALESKIKAKSE